MKLQLLPVIASALAIGAFSAPASADTWGPYAAVQCRGNAIAIRTGGQYGVDAPYLHTLPAAYAAQWQDVPLDADATCMLATGETVRVRFGGTNSKLTGAGALNPPTWVSVWIDGKKVLSREIYKAGFEGSLTGPFLNSIFVSRSMIERCAYSTNQMPNGPSDNLADVVCKSAPINLDALRTDPLEPSPLAASASQFTFTATYNPDFCRRFIRRLGDINPKTDQASASKEVIAPPAEATYPFDRDRTKGSYGSAAEVARFDYWNDGNPRTGVRFWLDDGYAYAADGVFFSLSEPDEAAVAAIVDAVKKATGSSARDFDFAALRKLGWYSPDVEKDISSIRLFRVDGATYFLRSSSDPSGPVILVRPGADGYASAPTETICIFQERRPNF